MSFAFGHAADISDRADRMRRSPATRASATCADWLKRQRARTETDCKGEWRADVRTSAVRQRPVHRGGSEPPRRWDLFMNAVWGARVRVTR